MEGRGCCGGLPEVRSMSVASLLAAFGRPVDRL